jgi:hypothetical protein
MSSIPSQMASELRASRLRPTPPTDTGTQAAFEAEVKELYSRIHSKAPECGPVEVTVLTDLFKLWLELPNNPRVIRSYQDLKRRAKRSGLGQGLAHGIGSCSWQPGVQEKNKRLPDVGHWYISFDCSAAGKVYADCPKPLLIM